MKKIILSSILLMVCVPLAFAYAPNLEEILRKELQIDLLEQKVKNDPTDSKGMTQLYEAYNTLAGVAKAMPDGRSIGKKYEKLAADISKKIKDGNYDKGWEFYFEEAKRSHSSSKKVSDRTFELIDKAIELSPQTSGLYFYKASYFLQNRKWREAAEALQAEINALIAAKEPQGHIEQERNYLIGIACCFDLDEIAYRNLRVVYDGFTFGVGDAAAFLGQYVEKFRTSKNEKIRKLIAQYDADPRFAYFHKLYSDPRTKQQLQSRWLCEKLEQSSFA